jgi:hypothetical protein
MQMIVPFLLFTLLPSLIYRAAEQCVNEVFYKYKIHLYGFNETHPTIGNPPA